MGGRRRGLGRVAGGGGGIGPPIAVELVVEVDDDEVVEPIVGPGPPRVSSGGAVPGGGGGGSIGPSPSEAVEKVVALTISPSLLISRIVTISTFESTSEGLRRILMTESFSISTSRVAPSSSSISMP